MPAHVTALHPFVPATDRVVVELRALCAASPVLDVRATPDLHRRSSAAWPSLIVKRPS